MSNLRILLRVTRLKRVARRHYEAHGAICDSYPCGVNLASYVNPKIIYHADRFNAAMAALERLDPNCPKGKRL